MLHDVPPYMLVEGIPARPRCINIVAMKRNQFSRDAIDRLAAAHRLLYRTKVGVHHAREILHREWADDRGSGTPSCLCRRATGRQTWSPTGVGKESRMKPYQYPPCAWPSLAPDIWAAFTPGWPRICLPFTWLQSSTPLRIPGKQWQRKQVHVPVADHRELVGEIDAAIVATPTSSHQQVASELMQAGVHTLIEKPLAPTLDGVRAAGSTGAPTESGVASGTC